MYVRLIVEELLAIDSSTRKSKTVNQLAYE